MPNEFHPELIHDLLRGRRDSFVLILWRHLTLGGVAFLWKECDIQEVSYKFVIYIQISKTLSIVVSVTNKINNIEQHVGLVPWHEVGELMVFFIRILTRSRDDHRLSMELPVSILGLPESILCLPDLNLSTTPAEAIENFAALGLFFCFCINSLFQAHFFFCFCINSHGWLTLGVGFSVRGGEGESSVSYKLQVAGGVTGVIPTFEIPQKTRSRDQVSSQTSWGGELGLNVMVWCRGST